MINQLKPVEIIKDEMGCWIHPEYLKYLDDNHADQEWLSQGEWDQLKKHFNIVTVRLYLEGSISDDLFLEIMDSSNLSKWDPVAPHCFFLIEIGFTEDGAEALFAKEVKAESKEGEQMLLTVNQTIQVTNLSKTTIYRMFDSGELKKVKLGGSTRVELSKELYEKYKEKIQALF